MATYYIRGDGNDTTGDGLTPATAWLTMSKAVSSSTTGDTITVVGGFGNLTFATQSFATARTVVGSASPVMDGAAANVSWSADITLDVTGIQFQNANRNSFADIFDNTGTAVMTFTNCIFTGLTTTAARAIFGKDAVAANGGTFKLVGCLAYNCTGASLAWFGTVGVTMDFVVYNCTFYSNVADANTPSWYTNVSGGTPAVNFDIRNTLVINDNGVNRAWNVSGAGGVTYTSTVPATVDTVGYTSLPAGLSGSIAVDPLFVDAAGSNFNLRPTSPVIDIGVVI